MKWEEVITVMMAEEPLTESLSLSGLEENRRADQRVKNKDGLRLGKSSLQEIKYGV